MPPTVKKLQPIEDDSTSEDSTTTPTNPVRADAVSVETTTLSSDADTSRSSSMARAPNRDCDGGADHSRPQVGPSHRAAAPLLACASSISPDGQADRFTPSPSPAMCHPRGLGVGGGDRASPLDEDVTSSAFQDCWSPTATEHSLRPPTLSGQSGRATMLVELLSPAHPSPSVPPANHGAQLDSPRTPSWTSLSASAGPRAEAVETVATLAAPAAFAAVMAAPARAGQAGGALSAAAEPPRPLLPTHPSPPSTASDDEYVALDSRAAMRASGAGGPARTPLSSFPPRLATVTGPTDESQSASTAEAPLLRGGLVSTRDLLHSLLAVTSRGGEQVAHAGAVVSSRDFLAAASATAAVNWDGEALRHDGKGVNDSTSSAHDTTPEMEAESRVGLPPAHASVDLVNVSAPSSLQESVGTAGHATRPQCKRHGRHADPLGKEAGKGRPRDVDSAAWVTSRRTALEQLRAELARPREVVRAAAESVDDCSGATTAHDADPSPSAGLSLTPPKTAHSVGPHLSSISHISPDKHAETSSVVPDAVRDLLLHGSPSTVGRPYARTARVTPTASARDRGSPSREVEVSGGRSPGSSDRSGPSRTKGSGLPGTVQTQYHVPGEGGSGAATALDLRRRRREELRREMEAKRMAECTFTPCVSPGSRSILAAKARTAEARAREGVAVAALDAAESRSGRLRSATATLAAAAQASCARGTDAPAGVSGVYERLYPADLREEQQRRQERRTQETYRAAAVEEMGRLRSALRAAVTESNARRYDLGPFLTNLLGAECRQRTPLELLQAGVLVHTSYQSPMAVAAEDARKREARRRGERSTASVAADESLVSSDESAEDSREYRIALFDEFLLRQNAHYFNRARTIREIEGAITPPFKPAINRRSAALVRDLVQRSLLEQTADQERSTLIQEHQRRGIPVSELLVTRHRSKYVDECTFSPKVSRVAEESRLKHGKPRTREATHENLYKDAGRQQRAREMARQASEADKLVGCTFTPETNRQRNTRVESLLDPKRSAEYSRYLVARREVERARREEAERLRQEQLALAAAANSLEDTTTEDLAACTFQPKTNKAPSYISRMARGFGIVRKMDVEF